MCCREIDREEEPEVVMATVYLRSISGRSLLDADPKSLTDPRVYRPDEDTVERAAEELQSLGFTIEGRGITMSISGSRHLFEQVTGAAITLEEREWPAPGGRETRKVRVPCSDQHVMQIEGLETDIEGIVLAVPGFPF